MLDEGYMYFMSKDAFVRRWLYVLYVQGGIYLAKAICTLFLRRHLLNEGSTYFITRGYVVDECYIFVVSMKAVGTCLQNSD